MRRGTRMIIGLFIQIEKSAGWDDQRGFYRENFFKFKEFPLFTDPDLFLEFGLNFF